MRRTVIVLAMCVAACSSSSLSARPSSGLSGLPRTQIPSLPCAGEQASPPEGFTVYFDAVALPAAPKYASALQTSSSGPGPSTRLWAKIGLWYRPDVAFEIVVPDQPAGRLAVGWGAPALPGPGALHDACPNAQHDWVALPGGYWASQTMCATVVVRSGNEEQQAKIGVGAPCPGQGPPFGHSDT